MVSLPLQCVRQPARKPLPATRMAIARFKPARVNIDYHVELDGHYYSAPQLLVGEMVELRITATTVEAVHGQNRVAAHSLKPRRGAHTTTSEHMPASHRAHLQWTPAKLIAWAERIGAATAAVVRWQMEHRAHPEQGYRSCLGFIQLATLDLLILDDFAIAPIAAHERYDLLELLDDRVGSRATLITSQLPVTAWHAWLDEPTLADAILDRIVHGSHKMALKGESMRRLAKAA